MTRFNGEIGKDAVRGKRKTGMPKQDRRICSNGHRYDKSSDCPVCPVCEKEKSKRSVFGKLSAPARRALEHLGIQGVAELSSYNEREILALHGMGPSSIPKLRILLKEAGMHFRNED